MSLRERINRARPWLALYLLFVAFSPGRLTSSDTGARLALAHALWTQGTVFVSGETAKVGPMVETPRGFTTYFGIAHSLVLIPFDMVAEALGRLTGSSYAGHLVIAFLYAPLAGLAWCFFTRLCLLRLTGDGRLAWLGTWAMALGTIAIVFISQDIQEESAVGALVMACLYAGIRYGETGAARWAVLTGAAAGLVLLFRLNACFALFGIAGWIADDLRARGGLPAGVGRAVPPVALGALPSLGLYLLFEYWRFGAFFGAGYELLARQFTFWQPVSLPIALALLLGIGKGFLILSPILWLALPGFAGLVRSRPLSCAFLAAGFGASLLFHSRLSWFADGSESWGTRYQAHWIGLWMLFATAAYRRFAACSWMRIGASAFLALGFVFQCLAAAAPAGLEYAQITARSGAYRAELLMGVRDGHLPMRIRNLLGRERGEPRSPTSGLVEKVDHFYRPNLWGFAWSRHLAERGARFPWPLLAWAMGVALLLLLLRLELRPRPAQSPPPDSR